MSETETQKVEAAIQKFSGRNLIAIVVATFSAAVWATSMKFDNSQIQKELEYIKRVQDEDHSATSQRIAEWSQWRKDIDSKVDSRLQDRYTATDYRWTAILFNMASPPVRLPDLDTVKRAQP